MMSVVQENRARQYLRAFPNMTDAAIAKAVCPVRCREVDISRLRRSMK